jgi:hypothetical protein
MTAFTENQENNPNNKRHKLTFTLITDFIDISYQNNLKVDYEPKTQRYSIVGGRQLIDDLINQTLRDLKSGKKTECFLFANVEFQNSTSEDPLS